MKDIQEHVVIKDQELTYTELPLYTRLQRTGLSQEARLVKASEHTHFDRKQLIISKEPYRLIPGYQSIKKLH